MSIPRERPTEPAGGQVGVVVGDDRFTELVAERVVLRRFGRGDAEPLSAYKSDPAVARYQSWEVPYPIEQAERFVNEVGAARPDTPGSWFAFAIASRTDGTLLGDCASRVSRTDPRTVEVGYTIASAHQRRGYGTEAVRRVLGYWFGDRAKHRAFATCDARNTASARLLERVGFRREGHLLESTWDKGEWTDDLLYGLLAREWEQLAG